MEAMDEVMAMKASALNTRTSALGSIKSPFSSQQQQKGGVMLLHSLGWGGVKWLHAYAVVRAAQAATGCGW
jgi:hypothetical protein